MNSIINFNAFASIQEYDQTTIIKNESLSLLLTQSEEKTISDNYPCEIFLKTSKQNNHINGVIEFAFTDDMRKSASVSLELEITDWKKDNYVLIPGAVYNGNRFHSLKLKYPPFLEVEPDKALTMDTTITDILRLSNTQPTSEIQLLSGDTTTPLIGFFDKHKKVGFFILTRHITESGYSGLFIKEDLQNGTAKLSICAPGVRNQVKYSFAKTDTVSDDEGVIFKKGDKVTIPFLLSCFPSETLADFYNEFFEIRKYLEKNILKNTVPFSEAYQAIKEKYDSENFSDEGFYNVGIGNAIYDKWQAGWVGGGINFYPFLLEDKSESFKRSISSLEFIFNHLQNDNGWIYAIYSNGKAYGDNFSNPDDAGILLIRKDSDVLYFALKELMFLREQGQAKTAIELKVKKLCDAFVSLWEKHGQLGQFINIKTDEIVTGNTAAGAMTIGALALAGIFFDETAYTRVAEELGDYYYNNYVSIGLTNGGPGEIAQCPDSESAFALLESYVELYEATMNIKWLQYAEQMAKQCASWVMSYDFIFPKGRLFDRRNFKTTGTVFANTQNKHSAPGICTLSGNSLLKLYRFTGNEDYIKLLLDISHNIMQFVSLKDRPFPTLHNIDMTSGYSCERVQTSDWEGKHSIGEIPLGSCWCEVSMLLTYVEVPGIYVDLKNNYICTFDHVECTLQKDADHSLKLIIKNPTAYDATVTLFIDDTSFLKPLGHNYFAKTNKLQIKSNETIIFSL